jgi:hypothetical protein
VTIRWTAEQRAEREAYRKRERESRKPKVRAEPKAHAAWSRPVLLPRRKLTDAEKAIVHSRSDGFCACGCGASLPVSGPEVQYDHILPRALGGSDEIGNYQALRTVPTTWRASAKPIGKERPVSRRPARRSLTGRSLTTTSLWPRAAVSPPPARKPLNDSLRYSPSRRGERTAAVSVMRVEVSPASHAT